MIDWLKLHALNGDVIWIATSMIERVRPALQGERATARAIIDLQSGREQAVRESCEDIMAELTAGEPR